MCDIVLGQLQAKHAGVYTWMHINCRSLTTPARERDRNVASGRGRVAVYYTNEAAERGVHFFKRIP